MSKKPLNVQRNESFNAPKGSNAVLTSAIVLSGLWLTAAGFNAPKGGNAVLTDKLRLYAESAVKSKRFNAPKGGNAVLTTVPKMIPLDSKSGSKVSMPRRAVMLF